MRVRVAKSARLWAVADVEIDKADLHTSSACFRSVLSGVVDCCLFLSPFSILW